MGTVVTLALDSFKGSIGAVEFGAALRSRLASHLPDADVVNFPCSDGGDGFAEAIGYHVRGHRVECTVRDPLRRPRTAHYVWSPADRLAVIESAQANGLSLVAEDERDPLAATTCGVADLLLDAKERGAGRIIVGVGGSATVDGGLGLAQALGYAFPAAGGLLGPRMRDWRRPETILAPVEHPFRGVEIDVACDVRTRLLGPSETSAVWIYGPQKGGTPKALARIEACLAELDDLVRSCLGREYGRLEMGGAAGGLAAGLAVFAGATLRPGMELFDEWTGLREQVARSAVVVTGEGRLDAQSSEGKVVDYVSRLCREAGVRVVALCGSTDGHDLPLDGVVALTDSGMSAADCIARPLEALDRVLPRLLELLRP